MKALVRGLLISFGLILSLSPAFFTPHAYAQTPNPDLLDPVRTGDITVGLETVATGLTAPNWGAYAPGVDRRLYVTDQAGILWMVNLDTGAKTLFLDVRSRLVELGIGGEGTFDERGLLGAAFHPNYARNGLFYTYTSEPVSGAGDFSTIPAGETANQAMALSVDLFRCDIVCTMRCWGVAARHRRGNQSSFR